MKNNFGFRGFNLSFIKEWETVKKNIISFIYEFHQNSSLPKGITSSFLALIPKNENPHSLKKYKMICLIGCLYKIRSKLLAGWIKQVFNKVNSPFQTTFILGRQILDGVVVLNKLTKLIKERKDKCMFLKVEFEKAFDSVN